MTTRKGWVLMPVLLFLASLACSLPSNKPTPQAASTLNALYTAAAQTLGAMATQSGGQTPLPPTLATRFATLPAATSVIRTSTPFVRCDAAAFVKDVTISDGTTIGRGTAFTKTWRIQNIGTCSWTSAYALVFISGDGLGAAASISLPGNVNPGDVVDLSVNMTAPNKDGHYRGYWKLRNASGVLFGIGPQADGPFWVDIIVAGPSYISYDFVSNYCAASWESNGNDLPCPGDLGEKKGFVVKRDAPVLESGKAENEAGLLTVPKDANNGFIRGKFPATHVQDGDRFRALVSCQYKAYACNVLFRLEYQIGGGEVKTLGQWNEAYEGQFYAVDIDLSSLADRNVKFILEVTANGFSSQDEALWVSPRIVSVGVPTLTPTPTQTSTPTVTPSASPTFTPSPTATLTATPTPTP